jgi:hypothetical protein
MAITLNHTIMPARDKEASTRFFGADLRSRNELTVLGLPPV